MKKLTLTEEQLESMSYGDVAQFILENNTKPISLQDLFKEVIRLMGLPESDFEAHIFDFFTLLSNDKNFIMLDKGMWDLTVRHQNKISISKEQYGSFNLSLTYLLLSDSVSKLFMSYSLSFMVILVLTLFSPKSLT